MDRGGGGPARGLRDPAGWRRGGGRRRRGAPACARVHGPGQRLRRPRPVQDRARRAAQGDRGRQQLWTGLQRLRPGLHGTGRRRAGRGELPSRHRAGSQRFRGTQQLWPVSLRPWPLRRGAAAVQPRPPQSAVFPARAGHGQRRPVRREERRFRTGRGQSAEVAQAATRQPQHRSQAGRPVFPPGAAAGSAAPARAPRRTRAADRGKPVAGRATGAQAGRPCAGSGLRPAAAQALSRLGRDTFVVDGAIRMSENTLASVGQTLREAREAQGMSLDEASMRLRLMHRQIAAMEADDFESLGQAVFARGFVRNYARLLGIVPEDLLARMQGAPAERVEIARSEPPLPRSWLSSPWLILLLLGVLVVVAVPVGLYLWLNSDVDDKPVNRVSSAAPVRSAAVPAAVPAPVAATADTAPEPSQAAPAAPPASAASPAGPAEAAAPAAPVSAAARSVLHLEFGAEAWTEIKDASGRMLHRQLDPAGSSVDVAGRPPFDVVIGNAAQARLTYNGRPIDLKPFTDSTVARFTLEE